MTKTFPTLVGFTAILTWSFLALLSTAAGPIPPFQLAGFGVFHWSVALACVLITAGAVMAARDMLFPRERGASAEEKAASSKA